MLFAFLHDYYYSEYIINVKNNRNMENSANTADMSVKEIIRAARGKLIQSAFAEKLKTSQSLISKYESGKTNPPAGIINECIKIIHGKEIEGDISMKSLEILMRKVLGGAAQAQARKAFAVILDSIA